MAITLNVQYLKSKSEFFGRNFTETDDDFLQHWVQDTHDFRDAQVGAQGWADRDNLVKVLGSGADLVVSLYLKPTRDREWQAEGVLDAICENLDGADNANGWTVAQWNAQLPKPLSDTKPNPA